MLYRIIKDTRGFIAEMGQTGMGIMKEDDLDMSLENHITNCWCEYKFPLAIQLQNSRQKILQARIREKHPWFWTLKEIISERPNLVPTGIGNNDAGYDLDILMHGDLSETGGYLEESSGLSDGIGMGLGIEDEDAEGGNEDEVNEGDTALREKKRKYQDADMDGKKSVKRVVVDEKKPTAPRAGKSTPAEPSSKKTKTGIERFADIAAREEETMQKALEVKRTKVQGETDRAVAKVKAQAEIQMNKDKLRAEYAQKKLEFEFKLQMAQQQQFHQFSGSPSSLFSGHQDQSGFSFNNTSYSSQASSGWQPNHASTSTPSSNTFPTASQPSSAFSGWEPTQTQDKVETPSNGHSLGLTDQLNNNDNLDDIY